MTRVRVSDDAATAAVAAAEWLEALVVDKLRSSDSCSIALSGGSSPAAMHTALSRSRNIDWTRVMLFFGDERCVPPDHPGSNYRMAHETLIAPAKIPDANVFRMEAESEDRERAALLYESLLPPALDVIVLGVGADGHTASLFPGADAVREAARRVVVASGPEPYPARLTITPIVISAARDLLVLAPGSNKAEAVHRALDLSTDTRSTPAALARRGTWFLDRPAAALIGLP